MASKPKRVALIGLDSAVTHLIEKHIAEGYLPTLKALFERGVVCENCLPPYPTITPPNWATIATGALPGTHQITDFYVRVPGTTPHMKTAIEAFDSGLCQAEYIWDAADKAGKKCIVLNYPTSWPSNMKNGLMVGGAGITPGENRAGLHGLEAHYSLCGNQCITTGFYPGAIRGSFEPAVGWQNLEEPGQEPLEMAAPLSFPQAHEPLAPATWYVLARQSGPEGYDIITLSPTKDMKDSFFTVRVGEWSPKVTTAMRLADGSVREAFFKAKLMELSEDAEEFRLFVTALVDMSPWCSPAHLAGKLASPEGVPVPSVGLVEYSLGIIDADTYSECVELYTEWLTDAALSLFREMPDWDVFFMHSHPPDYTYHAFMTDMDPNLTADEAKRAKAWEVHRKMYESQDRMIARLVEAAGPETLFAIVSDHGAVPDGPTFDPHSVLVAKGLTVVEEIVGGGSAGFFDREVATRGYKSRPILSQSKALPHGVCYVYINVKGRDPEGIVDPADYEKVQQEIIDGLYTYVDPKSGKRPIALALAKRDARLLGLHGEKVGDVVYAYNPWFGPQHGDILPTGEWGVGTVRTVCVLAGPGIKQGARLQRTVGLQDLVPTICHVADLPMPKDVEGAVIFQALEDLDYNLHQAQELSEALAKLEAALASR